jgi:hypothetical protein
MRDDFHPWRIASYPSSHTKARIVVSDIVIVLESPMNLPSGASHERSEIWECKVQVIFYSLYGHVYRLAEAVAEGARQVPGAQVELLQVAETLPAEVLAKMGAVEAKKAFAHVPTAQALVATELLGPGLNDECFNIARSAGDTVGKM